MWFKNQKKNVARLSGGDTAASHLFFSSSSLLAFFLNLGRSCCSSSFAASLSLRALLSLEKWNVVLSPVWRTSWSWILALPSGLIFWPVRKTRNRLKTTTSSTSGLTFALHLIWWLPSTHSGYLHTSGWLWSGLYPPDPRLYVQPSDKVCHPASSGELSSPPAALLPIVMPWLQKTTAKTRELSSVINNHSIPVLIEYQR